MKRMQRLSTARHTYFASSLIAAVLIANVGTMLAQVYDLPRGRVGETYRLTVPASGGIQPYTFDLAEGFLPPGLQLDEETGVLSGKLEEPGHYVFTIGVRDSRGVDVSEKVRLRVEPPQISIAPLNIRTTSLPGAVEGEEYHLTLAAEGGVPPIEWEIKEGELPAGVELDSQTGDINGTPEETGTRSIVLRVSDSQGVQTETVQPLDLTVASKQTPMWWVVLATAIATALLAWVIVKWPRKPRCPDCKSRNTDWGVHDGSPGLKCHNCGKVNRLVWVEK
jgi:hypothetical protein